ncbi:glycerate kinase [Streptomyces sp. HSG2]|uniref:glycerate kinase n=1 Tax=Streptomyces sp. HSG2 TaxID=2797167 RepID=UPI001907A11B|nr:glycerate kinase [Streptomyces sp. HSG2]
MTGDPRRSGREGAEGRGGVLVAVDKFRGSLTGAQVAHHVVAGVRRASPDVPVAVLPVADGGEGTVEAALAAGFARREAHVSGPTGRRVVAVYALRGDTAVVETAQAGGLGRLPGGRAHPLTATTYGAGELLRAALDDGARTVVLGVGGSASTDGGAGMLAALGWRLLDAEGAPVGPGGAGLTMLAAVDPSGADPRLSGVELVLAGDVDNPLTGPRGAAAVYGPQKGASRDEVRVLDAALVRLVRVLEGVVGPGAGACAESPGAGAGGGLGFAALLSGARFRPGVEVVLDVLGGAEAIRRADLVITGEGSLDAQTPRGKVPAGVAAAARAEGREVVAVCGRLALSGSRLRRLGIGRAYPLTDVEPDPARSMAEAGPLVERVAERLARDHLGGAERRRARGEVPREG